MVAVVLLLHLVADEDALALALARLVRIYTSINFVSSQYHVPRAHVCAVVLPRLL